MGNNSDLLPIIVIQPPQVVSRREKPMEDDESLGLANAYLSRPNICLTKEEEDRVLQWI
jgi:hypothetical protein